MEKESTSFWADIKRYEDALAKDPNSYCFAPLSELYRKIGLIDDAISVAQRGTEVHPEYVGGYMALGRAYFEKGLKKESKEFLERVAKATPENLLAQKILFQMYHEEGDYTAAERALEILVNFNPEDIESRLTLEAMRRSSSTVEESESEEHEAAAALIETETGNHEEEDAFSGVVSTSVTAQQTDAASTELRDSHEPLDILSEEEEAEEGEESAAVFRPSPVPTLTLAELYASQGFLKQALGVYEELLREDPDNVMLLERVDSLRHCQEKDSQRAVLSSANAGMVFDGTGSEAPCSDVQMKVEPVHEMSHEQVILDRLEEWLNSVRRIRECR